MHGRPEDRDAPLATRIARLASIRYAIVFAVRSGSTLLCTDLAQAGLGVPTEHFQGPAIGESAVRYVEHIVAEQAPVFGTKVSWEQAFTLLRRLADEGALDSFDLREAFGADLRVVRMVRRNKARQAVSTWRAAVSGVWHLPPGVIPAPRLPPYDRDALVSIMMQLLAEDWLWDRHLADLGLDVLTVTYEDYIEDRVGWVGEIARHVGRPLRHTLTLVDRLKPMADDWTDVFEDRLLDDLSAPTHPFWGAENLRSCVPGSLPVGQCIPLPRSVIPFPERSGRTAKRATR